MKPYYHESGATLYHGDCLTVLASLPENSVDTVITDPPYELGFMGKTWDSTGVAFRPETWAAVLRVAKPGAMLLAFGGTRTFHRLTCAIEDAGWEIRDCLSYLYGSGFPKSHNFGCKCGGRVHHGASPNHGSVDATSASEDGSGASPEPQSTGQSARKPRTVRQQRGAQAGGVGTCEVCGGVLGFQGFGTALKPGWEPIVVAMKPLDGTFVENAIKHGVGGLNIDAARIPSNGDKLGGGACGSTCSEGWDRPWKHDPKHRESHIAKCAENVQKAELLGRWPANVLLDEVAAELLDAETDDKLHGAGFAREHYTINSGGVATNFGNGRKSDEPNNGGRYGDTGGASRFFYTAKASKSDRGHGNDHPTVKPTELMKYLCTVTATPTGGVVLDPFAGSGTTLVAARECGRPSIGIELEAEHCAIIVKRLAQGCLFMEGGAA